MTVVMMLRAIVDALNGLREELKRMNDMREIDLTATQRAMLDQIRR